VSRVAEKLASSGIASPHFLGAIVVQQQPNEIGTLSVRTVIDGQQRLTTLQILLDCVHSEIEQLGYDGLAKQAKDLVENQEHFTATPEDKFKVWPTNRDRAAFNEVMGAQPPRKSPLLFFSGNPRMAEIGRFAIAGQCSRFYGE
jgi:hypothetical protein